MNTRNPFLEAGPDAGAGRNLPAPLPAPARRPGLTRRPPAFLAQLSRQYDGISVRRAARCERMRDAAQTYGAALSRRKAPPAPSSHDISI